MSLRRRDLLRLAALGAAVPLLEACRSGSRAPTPSPTVALQDVEPAAAPILRVVDAEPELLAGTTRYAFGLADDSGPVLSDDVTVHVGRSADRPPETTVAARRLTEEIADRGLYVAPVRFPAAGSYLVAVVARRSDGTRIKGGTRLTVGATSPAPVPGARMPAVPTPTTARPLGADPLCSRRPPCSMHAVSLDAALRAGRPTVVVFAAPAFCVTELCGPDVDILQRVADANRDAATFVHVEAYRKDGKELAPVLQRLRFQTEPWLYFVDAGGVVRDRIAGAFGSSEVLDRLETLRG